MLQNEYAAINSSARRKDAFNAFPALKYPASTKNMHRAPAEATRFPGAAAECAWQMKNMPSTRAASTHAARRFCPAGSTAPFILRLFYPYSAPSLKHNKFPNLPKVVKNGKFCLPRVEKGV